MNRFSLLFYRLRGILSSFSLRHQTLEERCKKIETSLPIPNNDLFMEFDLVSGNPWSPVVSSAITTYYSCLFDIARQESPKKILEIGTAFGMSAAALLKSSRNIELFISIDLGIFSDHYAFPQNNIDYARDHVHAWCHHHRISVENVRFFQANTQPDGIGDNENAGNEITRWHQLPDLVRLLNQNKFDIIFIDGKHTGDGLLNDFVTFWPFLKEGGLVICDDLHDGTRYKDIFPWAGQTLHSFHRFSELKKEEIADSCIWNFPQVIPGGDLGLRPFGLVRKNRNGSNNVGIS